MHIVLFFILLAFIVLFVIFIFAIRIIGGFVGGVKNLWYLITGKGIKNQQNSRKYGYTNTDYNTSSNSKASEFSSSSRSSQSKDTYRSTSTGKHRNGEKVFQDDEGEYVDFIEIKD
jgi:hypothetical protein